MMPGRLIRDEMQPTGQGCLSLRSPLPIMIQTIIAGLGKQAANQETKSHPPPAHSPRSSVAG
jgi:hypothetical protein